MRNNKTLQLEEILKPKEGSKSINKESKTSAKL